MTQVRTALAEAARRLAEAGVASPRNDAELLLAHVLGTGRSGLLLVDGIDDAQAAAYEELVVRRAAREPLQHLTGSAAFRYRDLAVGPGVFVPRPETESLVEWGLSVLDSFEVEHPVVVDLGTGSGAIAGAVASERPHTRVHAVELGDAAFAYAENNLAGLGVDLRHGDLAEAFPDLDGTVDLVLANPPYIPLTAWESVAVEARDHDPDLALWSGEDGLDAMRDVAATAARLLRHGGWVGAEHADVQGASAPAVFVAHGAFEEVRDRADLAGRPRFVTARRARR
ncbi:peptide chain release factor N(5)-glutamine methyltransferase [Mumia sp. zg.B53]|uniref:peptide chain release factor N(5)-glutamine methyltransferase n=1 Tax=Mumia sp. zg.B53 TaxID=2855449 RepID=UPI001C6E660A|nr:peptide chain release factor N(5)-glutamine methyltransferase [Mumia sp. zg.B53]MBW9215676.1 peptide chain release factor N(5)-glutamine methyltransferase [Mumia sp. zg.B53]